MVNKSNSKSIVKLQSNRKSLSGKYEIILYVYFFYEISDILKNVAKNGTVRGGHNYLS